MCVCTVDIATCLCTICYRYLKRTFLDGKSCTWKTICNHNKDSDWPAEMLTVAEFLTSISVYIKHVCAVPLFYIQIHTESIPGSLWSRLSAKGWWLWHEWEWLENTQDPSLRSDSDWHELAVLSNNLAAHLQPAAPGRALGSRNGGQDHSVPLQHTHVRPVPASTHLLPPLQGSAATNPPVQLPYIHLLGERIL